MINCADHTYTIWLLINGLTHSTENQLRFANELHRYVNWYDYQINDSLNKNKKSIEVSKS